jgi:hypothetical protein
MILQWRHLSVGDDSRQFRTFDDLSRRRRRSRHRHGRNLSTPGNHHDVDAWLKNQDRPRRKHADIDGHCGDRSARVHSSRHGRFSQ